MFVFVPQNGCFEGCISIQVLEAPNARKVSTEISEWSWLVLICDISEEQANNINLYSWLTLFIFESNRRVSKVCSDRYCYLLFSFYYCKYLCNKKKIPHILVSFHFSSTLSFRQRWDKYPWFCGRRALWRRSTLETHADKGRLNGERSLLLLNFFSTLISEIHSSCQSLRSWK